MNQILGKTINLDCNLNNSKKLNLSNNYNNIKYLNKKFKIILFISIIFTIFFIIFYFLLKYNANKKEILSKHLASNFTIQNLYSTNDNYSAEKTLTLANKNNVEPFVIGLLKIDKIDLMYPILSYVSDELLEISPCRFYGPMPNEIGNLCIAGHNYINKKHFGRLSSLDSGDIVEIYDLNYDKIDYMIYEKLEVSADDTSCINQNTNGFREITLITCNTIKGTRIVLKGKEV